MFFSFDGLDGAGKSTQISRFVDWLRQRGHSVVECRDPGSTPLGESLRDLVLHNHQLRLNSTSEMLVYMASRAQLVSDVIRPALARGECVVSDRFLLANVVYQGHAGGLPPEIIWRVGEVATGGLQPALTFVLDLPVEAAAARLQGEPDRMEAKGLEFMRRVRAGFIYEAEADSERLILIDANQTADEVQAAVRAAARRLVAEVA